MIEKYFIPYEPTQLTGRHFAVIAPHPDDEVFGCGGTIALASGNSIKISVLVLTDGSGQPGEAGITRKEESRKAGTILGYDDITFWDLPDGGLFRQSDLDDRIREWLEARQPDNVFFPSVWEMHRDHRATAEAALRACDQAQLSSSLRCLMYEVGYPLQPNCLIDISETRIKKQRAMAVFASQLAHQQYDRHISALNIFRTYTLSKNVQAAEAFKIISKSEIGDFLHRNTPIAFSEALHQATCELEELKCQLEKQNVLAARLGQLEGELFAIKSSRCWRWSAPFRLVSRMLARAFKLESKK
ncbi:PIG-L deacetylase family protein [Pseudomonadota bacterium 24LQ007]